MRDAKVEPRIVVPQVVSRPVAAVETRRSALDASPPRPLPTATRRLRGRGGGQQEGCDDGRGEQTGRPLTTSNKTKPSRPGSITSRTTRSGLKVRRSVSR
jgi:hypothetical protein